MTEAIQTTRTCSVCAATKPATEYHRNARNADGLTSTCKPCALARTASWDAVHPERGWVNRYRSRARAFGFDPVVRSFSREDMLTYWNNGPFCIYCDAAWSEIEHLIPVGMGGIHAVENVAPSCLPCNRQNVWTVVRERRAMAAA